MPARVSCVKWDEDAQMFVPVPLDDADQHSIELARRLAKLDNPTKQDVVNIIQQMEDET